MYLEYPQAALMGIRKHKDNTETIKQLKESIQPKSVCLLHHKLSIKSICYYDTIGFTGAGIQTMSYDGKTHMRLFVCPLPEDQALKYIDTLLIL